MKITFRARYEAVHNIHNVLLTSKGLEGGWKWKCPRSFWDILYVFTICFTTTIFQIITQLLQLLGSSFQNFDFPTKSFLWTDVFPLYFKQNAQSANKGKKATAVDKAANEKEIEIQNSKLNQRTEHLIRGLVLSIIKSVQTTNCEFNTLKKEKEEVFIKL